MAVIDEKLKSIESYGWNELLSLRHTLSTNVKEITAKIIDIDAHRCKQSRMRFTSIELH